MEANPPLLYLGRKIRLLLYKSIEFGMGVYVVVISEDIVTDFSPYRGICARAQWLPASCLHVWVRLIKFKHMIN